jgi:hypothetical protein
MQEFNEKKTKNIFIAEDGSTAIQGNLIVSGTNTTQDTETLAVKDNVIVTNVDGNTLIENAGFAVKTNTADAYGIMYDPVGDGVKIGLGSLSEDGKFTYTVGEDQFLATRSDVITDGNLVQWDDTEKTLIDSGEKISDYAKVQYVDSYIPKMLPDVTEIENNKILQVVNGAWTVTKPTIIYVGAAEPTNETGEDGDLYLQTD